MVTQEHNVNKAQEVQDIFSNIHLCWIIQKADWDFP